MNHGYLEEAASLSEKYLEFNALVKICEATNDSARLEKYMDQFADQVGCHPNRFIKYFQIHTSICYQCLRPLGHQAQLDLTRKFSF